MTEALLPYVLATPRVQRALGLLGELDDPHPATRDLSPDRLVDPMRVASSPLVDGIQRLDAALFGERRMSIPRWALYDCAGLPGAVIGFGKPANQLTDEERRALAIEPAFEGFAPLSMMMAIPMVGRGRWLVYTLGSLAAPPGEPREPSRGAAALNTKTLSFGLDLLRHVGPAAPEQGPRADALEVRAIAQWDSPELAAFAALARPTSTPSPPSGPRVLAAWMPAHDHPATAILDLDIAANSADSEPAASGLRPPAAAVRTASLGGDRFTSAEDIAQDLSTLTSIDVHDAHALRRLQRDIELGHAVRIIGSPCFQGPSQRVPIYRSASPSRGTSSVDVPDPSLTISKTPSLQVDPAVLHATELHPANERLLRDLVPFVVATPDHQARLDLAPFGRPIPAAARFDPLRVESAPFLGLLSRLDALTFGPEGMPMPRWLFLDGSALPAGIVGLAREASALDPEARAIFGLSDEHAGLVPLAMYIAVPTLDRTTWVGHNLASAAERLPHRGLEGLGRLAKALGLAVYGARAQIGATQWASRALHVHARLGPLDLLSAWTPAHADIETLTYSATIDDATLHHLAGDPAGHIDHPPPDLWIDSADPTAMQALQSRIEAGERFQIVGPPQHLTDHHQRVPVHERT